MILSAMLDASETDLVCDFAETYGVYDWRSLPLQTAAALAVGLRGDSRIKMRLAGTKLTTTEYLLAVAVDYLALLWWVKTKDGQKGANRPKSIREMLTGDNEGKDKGNDIVAFDSPEDFNAARERILKG